MKNNSRKKRRKKKKRVKKGFVSAAAFILAAVVVVFCVYHVVYKTDFFLLKGVDIEGLVSYSHDYAIEKGGIVMGEKIFTVDRKKIEERLEQEMYIKDAYVMYELPDRLYIKVEERQEAYQVYWDQKYIITDEDGVVMNIYEEKSQLLTIESLTDVIYNIGDSIKFEGINDTKMIFDIPEYIDKYGDGVIAAEFSVAGNDSAIFNTEYGVRVQVDLDIDIGYQITAALKIIAERLTANLTVSSGDLIDFTRYSDGIPAYVDESYNVEDSDG